jgi:uncharacterized membrane protein YjgN (DUF898 family)
MQSRLGCADSLTVIAFLGWVVLERFGRWMLAAVVTGTVFAGGVLVPGLRVRTKAWASDNARVNQAGGDLTTGER